MTGTREAVRVSGRGEEGRITNLPQPEAMLLERNAFFILFLRDSSQLYPKFTRLRTPAEDTLFSVPEQLGSFGNFI